MTNGWEDSAAAWITDMGERGDYAREFVLDAPMMERVRAGRFANALDVGCGEGRFCRMMQACGIATIGIDPVDALLAQARMCDPAGDYRRARAESPPFADDSFDLVVSYLTLIDIDDIVAAIHEMARVLRPGGRLLIANLTSFVTAAGGDYLKERAEWVGWRGINIRNWHRPLQLYMIPLIGEGLNLRYFAEPEPVGGDEERRVQYRLTPYFLIMEWEKPPSTSSG